MSDSLVDRKLAEVDREARSVLALAGNDMPPGEARIMAKLAAEREVYRRHLAEVLRALERHGLLSEIEG